MGEQAGRPNGEAEGPLTENQEIPALVVSRDELQFNAHGVCMRIPLHTLMSKGDAGAVGLLLYAVVLQLRDVNHSLHALATVAQAQQARVEGMTSGGAQQIVGDVIKHLKDLRIFPPEVAGAVLRPAGGDGRDTG